MKSDNLSNLSAITRSDIENFKPIEKNKRNEILSIFDNLDSKENDGQKGKLTTKNAIKSFYKSVKTMMGKYFYSFKMNKELGEIGEYSVHRRNPSRFGQITKSVQNSQGEMVKETVVIENTPSGKYRVYRLPLEENTDANSAEDNTRNKYFYQTYNSLDELRQALKSDEFGWGRTSQNGSLNMYELAEMEEN